MAFPFPLTLRRARRGLLALTIAWLSLAITIYAIPAPPGSAPTTIPAGAPSVQGWVGIPQGVRSADAHAIVTMIPHHAEAIVMADLALQRSRGPELRALADRIRTSQGPKNSQMRPAISSGMVPERGEGRNDV